ncbi:hypothetical protein PCL_02432 [Purpureocillium lilacinum]|uniref:Uncharacterized protein n=1 Tax=Purpureocillium lilacinum TaxID=33203 RepID=A0A2U3E0I5_PURLI|nr:hypothetical protein PCL_02432 [Purpureocillium lilacinum]
MLTRPIRKTRRSPRAATGDQAKPPPAAPLAAGAEPDPGDSGSLVCACECLCVCVSSLDDSARGARLDSTRLADRLDSPGRLAPYFAFRLFPFGSESPFARSPSRAIESPRARASPRPDSAPHVRVGCPSRLDEPHAGWGRGDILSLQNDSTASSVTWAPGFDLVYIYVCGLAVALLDHDAGLVYAPPYLPTLRKPPRALPPVPTTLLLLMLMPRLLLLLARGGGLRVKTSKIDSTNQCSLAGDTCASQFQTMASSGAPPGHCLCVHPPASADILSVVAAAAAEQWMPPIKAIRTYEHATGQHKDQKKAPRRRRISDQHHQNHPGSLACPALGALASPLPGGEVVLVAALTQGRGIVARRPGAGASASWLGCWLGHPLRWTMEILEDLMMCTRARNSTAWVAACVRVPAVQGTWRGPSSSQVANTEMPPNRVRWKPPGHRGWLALVFARAPERTNTQVAAWKGTPPHSA